MHPLWKHITSSRHLTYFEAAARLGSITRAADELNVKQPAVSTAVKQLEESLGVLLFHREHKRIVLTSAGARLFSDISRAFDSMLASVNSVQQLSRNEHITLNASTAFNVYWMMPRLQEFHQAFPEIDLRLQSSDREPDIDSENISLAIRRGSGQWPGCHSALVAEEVIYPVASPAQIAACAALKSPLELMQQRLIHLEEPIRDRPSWRDWFAHFGSTGVPPASGLRLNDYALVLQAAIAGEGIAFGWDHLTAPLVEQRVLAARKEWQWRTGFGFYLVWSQRRPMMEDAKRLRDWLLRKTEPMRQG